MRRLLSSAVAAALLLTLAAPLAAPAVAQAQDWRTVAPENLLIIDTVHGRILVELDPRVAPRHVERVRALADQGFYDGLKFHRVITGFMAQTGDPQGTGMGGSELPDLEAEFSFRRGPSDPFAAVENAGPGLRGVFGVMPAISQPDAQMYVTADMKTGVQALFCPGVAGMARSGDPNSANSQFFLMTGANTSLDGGYTPFGRVVSGMEAVRAIRAGPEGANGRVETPDLMLRARTAAALPATERPTVRVMDPRSPGFAAVVEAARQSRGSAFGVCDLMPPVEVTGG